MKSLNKFIKDMFMGPQNIYWDYARVILWLGNIMLFSLTFWNVFGLENEFNAEGFATAFSILNGPTILAASFRDKQVAKIEVMKEEAGVP